MNFGLTEDQLTILSEVERLLGGVELSAEPEIAPYSDELDFALADSGFLDIAREEDFGLLDAALVTECVTRQPHIVEVSASAIVAPALDVPAGERPIALLTGADDAPVRFLRKAKVLVVDRGDRALIVAVDPSRVVPIETVFAYQYGRLDGLKGLEIREFEDVGTLRRRWRIAVAIEAAGCMAGALALVVEHVKTRHAFGRPLGAFQAIQHRLAMAAETVESTKWLALCAAWSDRDSDAAIAAGFAQHRIAQITYDLHQFTGAMGLTLEFPLHRWTYRLRALAGELGGASAQLRHAARATWPDPTP